MNTKTTQHTHLPWHLVDHEDEACQIQNEDDSVRIADVWMTDFEFGAANAALIVKAVNGYQGLVDALRNLIDVSSTEDLPRGVRDAAHTARAALKQAEGGE